MDTQNPAQVRRAQERLEQEDRRMEAVLYQVLSTDLGRILVGWLLEGDHGLAHVYQPSMSFDEVAWHAGRQYTARELARVANSTERCSALFHQAYREQVERTRAYEERGDE